MVVDDLEDASMTTQDLNPECPRCSSVVRPVMVFSAEAVLVGDLCYGCNFFQTYPDDAAWQSRWQLNACKEWEKGNLSEEDLNHLLILKRKLTSKKQH